MFESAAQNQCNDHEKGSFMILKKIGDYGKYGIIENDKAHRITNQDSLQPYTHFHKQQGQPLIEIVNIAVMRDEESIFMQNVIRVIGGIY